jgi:aldose 1-epimerase
MIGNIEKILWGITKQGIPVYQYILTNKNNLIMKVITYGATVIELWVPDKNGILEDIVLGFDTLGDYESDNNPFFGCIVGRYANRISKGSFMIDGIKYQLALNDGNNHLHGGLNGFHRVVFTAIPMLTPYGPAIRFKYKSHDGEEGYPGNLDLNIIYYLTNENEFKIEYFAVTDKPTIVNLTNHSYFNLAGNGDILNHELWIDADNYTEVDDELIPTGKILPVKDTPLDFTKPRKIGERIDKLLNFVAKGYDHNFVLNKRVGEFKLVAKLREEKSGRIMEVYTTEPGIQLYTGNYLNIKGKNGKYYGKYSGLCLETQHYPDSPNHPEFPSVMLKPGEIFHSITSYKFLIEG